MSRSWRDPLQRWLTIGTCAALFAAWLIVGSYCDELPEYRFEREAQRAGNLIPGSRLVSISKIVRAEAPATWIRPEKFMWVYAQPHPTDSGAFGVTIFRYQAPIVRQLIDADCDMNSLYVYSTEAERGPVAIDELGAPLKTSDGRLFRGVGSRKPSAQEFSAYCEQDWSKARSEYAAAFEKFERTARQRLGEAQ